MTINCNRRARLTKARYNFDCYMAIVTGGLALGGAAAIVLVISDSISYNSARGEIFCFLKSIVSEGGCMLKKVLFFFICIYSLLFYLFCLTALIAFSTENCPTESYLHLGNICSFYVKPRVVFQLVPLSLLLPNLVLIVLSYRANCLTSKIRKRTIELLLLDGASVFIIVMFLWRFISLNVLSVTDDVSASIVVIGAGMFCLKLWLGNFRLITKEAACSYLQELISNSPYIKFRVKVYRKEKATRWVPTQESEIRESDDEAYEVSVTKWNQETYEEVVEDYEKSDFYQINSWEDYTKNSAFLFPQSLPLIRMKVKVVVCPGSEKSRLNYEREWAKFIARNKRLDNSSKFSTEIGIVNHGNLDKIDFHFERLLVLLNPEECPFFLKNFVFILLAMTPFSGTYSLWIDKTVPISMKTIVKKYF